MILALAHAATVHPWWQYLIPPTMVGLTVGGSALAAYTSTRKDRTDD